MDCNVLDPKPFLFFLLCSTCVVGSFAKPNFFTFVGDINLNADGLGPTDLNEPWGDFLEFFHASSMLFGNHESTMANIAHNGTIEYQFEDPVHFSKTFGRNHASFDFLMLANNHQFDFGPKGAELTIKNMKKAGLNFGGLGTAEEVMKPVLLRSPSGKRIAIFTFVVQDCSKDLEGVSDDNCTCWNDTNPRKYVQCYQAGEKFPVGSWFVPLDKAEEVITSVVKSYIQLGIADTYIVGSHCGPNMLWIPRKPRRDFYKSLIDVGVDLVWGSSTHHLQGVEYYKGAPIIYSAGDFLFRNFAGLDTYCFEEALPCTQFRPNIGMVFTALPVEDANGHLHFPNIIGIPSKHDYVRAHRISSFFEKEDYFWATKGMEQMSSYLKTKVKTNRLFQVFGSEDESMSLAEFEFKTHMCSLSSTANEDYCIS
eukprot:TRINITY_DN706_c0_g1_i1.p1 TRINITY_DN706_c0_g1~~TRINITY_DN706_c0_g1_i1.p1  ORF type:complete len:424 (+),score=96.10 TRINITY_DN706_c0_g1_i1:152-1423(+)